MRQLCNVTVLLLLFGLTSCQNNGDKQTTMSPVKVKVLRVSSSEIDGTERFSGTVEEANSTSLSFSIMGTVKTVHVGLGDRVAKGQLIATVDPLSMQSSYDAAKASLEQAEDAYRRMKELYDKGSLPEIKWVEVQSKLQQAKSMEEVARKNLDDCKLYAPFSGIISEKMAEVGQNIMPGLPVVKLVTANQLKVKIAVPETEIAAIATGQKATITVSALNGRVFAGTVTEREDDDRGGEDGGPPDHDETHAELLQRPGTDDPPGAEKTQQEIAHHRGGQDQGQRQDHVQHALHELGELCDVVRRGDAQEEDEHRGDGRDTQRVP